MLSPLTKLSTWAMPSTAGPMMTPSRSSNRTLGTRIRANSSDSSGASTAAAAITSRLEAVAWGTL